MSEQRFVVGQKIECMDGNDQKWYCARIKDVKFDKVLVRWSNPKWQNSKYDQYIVKAHYDLRIRPRKNQINQNYNQVSSLTSQMKHIDDWTHNELCQWMCSLNGISSRNQKQIIKSIMTDEISGRDFNTSIDDMSDVRHSLPDVSDNGVKNIYIGLQQLRATQYQFNITQVDVNNEQFQYGNQPEPDIQNEEIKQRENKKTDNIDSDAIITDLLNIIETQNNEIDTLKQEKEEYITAKGMEIAHMKHVINTITQEKERIVIVNNMLEQKVNDMENEKKDYEMKIIQLTKQVKQLKIKRFDANNVAEWDSNDVINWILSLENGIFMKYEKKIKQEIIEGEVIGEDLVTMNIEDIKALGISTFGHRKLLQNNIQKLVQRNNDANNNEGMNVPTAYM